MIGKLRGLVDEVGVDNVIIDVGGVGYDVSCPSRTLGNLPPKGTETTLVIETYVREDQLRLFGFSTATDREAFRLLQTVQGVGAKVALAILGIMTPSEIASAVSFGEKAHFTRVPGVGPRVAERLITELKNKVAAFGLASVSAAANIAVDQTAGEAVSALTNLGYSKEQASQAVLKLKKLEPEATVEALIRKGLRELATV